VNNKTFSVFMNGAEAIVNGKAYQVDVTEGASGESAVPIKKSQAATADAESIRAPMPGTVVRVSCIVGDNVMSGDELIVLEAMKMEVPLKAPADGTVSSISVVPGDQVTSGQILAYIN
jgi:pyruvate carboxylase subunit B